MKLIDVAEIIRFGLLLTQLNILCISVYHFMRWSIGIASDDRDSWSWVKRQMLSHNLSHNTWCLRWFNITKKSVQVQRLHKPLSYEWRKWAFSKVSFNGLWQGEHLRSDRDTCGQGIRSELLDFVCYCMGMHWNALLLISSMCERMLWKTVQLQRQYCSLAIA